MNKNYYILISIIIILLIYYHIAYQPFREKNVLKHNLWEHVGRTRIRGDFIDTEYLIMNNDTLILDSGKDTLILKSQYFSTIKVIDPKTKETGIYAMKGANWTDYLFK